MLLEPFGQLAIADIGAFQFSFEVSFGAILPNTQEFMADLRERVLGSPEISTDGFTPYLTTVRDYLGNSAHDQPEFAKPPMPEEEVQQTFCGT